MILVVDSTQPARALRFLVEVLDATDLPAVIALNMIDLATARDFEFNVGAFEEAMGVPVIPTVATKRRGLKELSFTLGNALKNQIRSKDAFLGEKKPNLSPTEISLQILSFYKKSDEYLKRILVRKGKPDLRSEKIDKLLLHPIWGMIILVLVLGVTFQLMFNLAQVPMDAIDGFFSWLGVQVGASGLPEGLKSFLADGIIAGVGGTLVFLPQILILFGLILFLEDFGFMARAVFLLDHWMGKVGLHGRAFLPLLSSHACAVPGIMSTRTIESKRDRIITTLIIPLTTCSARIPVYTLLIAGFIPNISVVAGIRLQGLVMLALYFTGILSAILMGGIFKKFLLKGKRPPLLIELPSYKWPSLASLGKGLLYRGKLFLKRVGTIILSVSVIIWFLVSFPKVEGVEHPIEQSFAAQIGHFMEPALRPLGFDWRIGMALIPTFAAREVMVSTLSTVYAVQDQAEVSNSEKLSEIIQKEWSFATGLSLIVWFIFAPMCISTLATAKREMRSTGWAMFMLFYLLALAYLASLITYKIASS